MCGMAQHSLANPMVLIGSVQLVPARCPTRQQLGPIYPNQSQLVPTSWALRMTKSPMPQLVFSQKSKLTTTNLDVAGAPQKILVLKTRVLGMCTTNDPSTHFEENTACFSGIVPVTLDRQHVTPCMPQTTHMTEHASQWHKMTQNCGYLQCF